jgi:small-conductance mechanosensitive channel
VCKEVSKEWSGFFVLWRDARKETSGMLTKLNKINIMYDADKDGSGGGNPDADNNENNQQKYDNFESFLNEQDEAVKELYQSDIAGLKTALKSERDSNKELADSLKELSSKVEKGSEAEQKLTEMANKLDAANKRANFAEMAIKPEIGCVNIKAAYALALADNLFDDKGIPQWEEVKKAAPELFRKPGKTDAGEGADDVPSDINAAIRKAAGR